MLNPWIILGIVLAWLGSLTGVGYWQHQDGVTVATAACQKKQLEVDTQSAVMLAAKSAKILEGETQHATDQNTINSLAAESGSVSVHIPIPARRCGNAKGRADQDRADRLFSERVDAALKHLQTGVEQRIVNRCAQLNIDAIASNTANK